MRSFFLSFLLVGNFLTYKFLRFCFDLHVRTFRFGSSKTNISPSVDKPRQEPINPDRALCPCNGVFIDQFIYRSIFPRILTIKKISKNRRLEDGFSDVLKTFTFFFSVIVVLWMRTRTGRCFQFRGKKCCQMVLKIN